MFFNRKNRIDTRAMQTARKNFDEVYYLANNEDVAKNTIDPFYHYMEFGWREGRNPSPNFHTLFYKDKYLEENSNQINPLIHFSNLSVSLRNNRSKFSEKEFLEIQKKIIKESFEFDYYQIQCGNITIEDPLLHYITVGWKLGYEPNRLFSNQEYLRKHPHLLTTGACPFYHYISTYPMLNDGAFYKAAPQLSTIEEPDVIESDDKKDLHNDIEAIEPYFNPAFYRMNNLGVDGSDEDLLLHFLEIGWKEGRDPSPDFSISYYNETYSDIAENKLNPFLHYILYGKSEGRRTRGDEPLRLINNPEASIVPVHLQSIIKQPKSKAFDQSQTEAANPDQLHIHWIIPDFSKGSGGHMTIFRIIRYLETFGHCCKIWIENPGPHSRGEDAWEDIVKYYQCLSAEVRFVDEDFFQSCGDALVATAWSTAYLAEQATGFRRKFYFVQDHEPEFYPMGSEYLLARRTYEFDFSCICASSWLSRLMNEKYGRWARHFDLAFDQTIYRINNKEKNSIPSVKPDQKIKLAVYSREHTARRCVSLSLIALQKLGYVRDDFEVHFFGQDVLHFNETNFNAVNHGVINAEKLAELYNSCDIGICFSSTNYSLVPQEMMACGLPVVELNSESTKEIFPEDVVTLVGPDPTDIAEQISFLMDDPAARHKQANAALNWVEKFSWEKSARVVENAITEALELNNQIKYRPATKVSKSIRLDVVIPTFNGINEIKPVISALRAQIASDQMQIHCIDSSSSDGTLEWIKSQSDISLTVIPQTDFQHGRTRNVGAALGKAEFVAFLTQDAIPVGHTWASDIFMMFDHSANAAGLFGRHLPYPSHPLYVQQEIVKHFENMLKYPLQLSKNTDEAKWSSGDLGWRQLLHFYSDNNSAMRRKIFEMIPYPEVDYGEDQLWAREIIDRGFTKIYAPTVCVYHSHDYNPSETYKRSVTEAEFFGKYFKYEIGTLDEIQMRNLIQAEQKQFLTWCSKNQINEEEMQKGLLNISAKYEGFRAGRLKVNQNFFNSQLH